MPNPSTHTPPPPFLPSRLQVAQHVLRGHLYRQPGETSDAPPTEPGIMDLMAEIKLNSDYKRAASAPVWLKGGNVLNGHHNAAGAAGGAQQEDWPEDELGESNIRDLGDIQVRGCEGKGGSGGVE